MNQKTKKFQQGDTVFQFGRLSPEDGSYWLGIVLTAGAEAIQKAIAKASKADKAKAATDAKAEGQKLPAELAEDMARGYASAALESLDRDTYRAIQGDCLNVTSVLVGEAPLRLRSDDGRWAFPDVAEDHGLVRKLTVEALTFNLTDFFERNLGR